MSLKQSTKDRIKKYILEKIQVHDTSLASKVADNFGVSLTTAYRYINQLCEEGVVEKNGRDYQIKSISDIRVYQTKDSLEEDKIFDEMISPVVKTLPDNVFRIWQYAFTEMMNNAIEHSKAKKIIVYIQTNRLTTNVIIDDDGIGIFEKIKTYCGYANLDDAVMELFKGKLTTDSANHTGEGIFFTSRMIESFAVLSSGKIFSHNTLADSLETIAMIPELKHWEGKKGTVILMTMPNKSKTNIKEVFDMFSDVDEGFNKTQIPLKSIFTDGFPVSRSQAKRLSIRFDNFREVRLDFEGIDDLGQGFAHELFVVFNRKHPEVELVVTNANDDVRRMIKHVIARK